LPDVFILICSKEDPSFRRIKVVIRGVRGVMMGASSKDDEMGATKKAS
jgi:hypothetical protein